MVFGQSDWYPVPVVARVQRDDGGFSKPLLQSESSILTKINWLCLKMVYNNIFERIGIYMLLCSLRTKNFYIRWICVTDIFILLLSEVVVLPKVMHE